MTAEPWEIRERDRFEGLYKDLVGELGAAQADRVLEIMFARETLAEAAQELAKWSAANGPGGKLEVAAVRYLDASGSDSIHALIVTVRERLY